MKYRIDLVEQVKYGLEVGAQSSAEAVQVAKQMIEEDPHRWSYDWEWVDIEIEVIQEI